MKAQIDKVIAGILSFLMFVITVVVLWGVFTRYAGAGQASWSEELARFLLIWIGVLGAAFVAGKREHLSLDLLKMNISPDKQHKLDKFISVLILFFAIAVLVVGGGQLIYLTQVLGQLSAAMRIPMSLVYSVIPLSGLLIVFYEIKFLIEK
ncbi:TRAP-type C4-dicarboxylate transport system, small permease component [Spirosomataceae bacterium TFI 002]|nr:TRAP-type C4-dicarboxylate transport system, small permease component [Spirosomataceae bacterium TFI 002]